MTERVGNKLVLGVRAGSGVVRDWFGSVERLSGSAGDESWLVVRLGVVREWFGSGLGVSEWFGSLSEWFRPGGRGWFDLRVVREWFGSGSRMAPKEVRE